MRVLLLADVHSNFAALEAVWREASAEPLDAVLFAGDLVDYGTDPLPCVAWLKRHATAAVRGNHDHAVAQRVPARGGGGFKALAAATRPLHWDLLTPRTLKYLGRLPLTRYHHEQGRTFFLVHGTPRDPMDEYLGEDADQWRQRLDGIDADYVVCGHTHRAMVLDVDGTRVVNPGSVGQPRDGRAGAAYAIVTEDGVDLRVAAYDAGRAVRQMRRTDVEPWAAELTEAVLASGGGITKSEMNRFVPSEYLRPGD